MAVLVRVAAHELAWAAVLGEVDVEVQLPGDLRILEPRTRGVAIAVDDGEIVDITDGVGILRYKFLGIPFGDCLSAADTDDSGAINTSDAIRLFSFLFLGGPPPLPPRHCGAATTSDRLGCPSFAACD